LLIAVMVSGIVGWHISQFQDASSDLVSMITGLAIGLLNGFVIAYAATAALNSVFWGNLFGMLLGLVLGVYYGRAGGLLGMLAGAMGGVMGGALGAILASVVRVPSDNLLWTGVLLGVLYLAGMIALVVLIEQDTPAYSAYHRLAPLFGGRELAVEESELPPPSVPRPQAAPARMAGPRPRRLVDFYAFLGVDAEATDEEIWTAYEACIADGDPAQVARAEQAVAVLTNAEQRRDYDRALSENRAALAAYEAQGAPAGRGPSKAPGQRRR